MAYQGKHTGADLDTQIDRVKDGSVVKDNTLHEVTSDDTLPVSGAAVGAAINRLAEQANQSIEQLRQSIDRLGTNALFADAQSGNIFFDGYSVANNYTLAKVKAQAAIDTVEIAKMPLYIVLRSGSAFRVMEATYRYLRTETSTLTLHAEYITEGVTITRYEVQCVEASDATWNITATHTTYTAPIAPLVMMCDADNNLTLSPDTPDATLTAIWNMQTKIYTSGGDTNTLPVIVRYFGKSTRLSCLLSFDSSVSSWRGMVYSHYNAKDIYFGLISVNVSYATDGSEKIIAGGTYEKISASQTGVASSINIIAMNAKDLAEQANERAQALEEASDYDLIARIDGSNTITFSDADAEANNAVMERLYADYMADKTVLSRRAVTIGCSPASVKTTEIRRLVVSDYGYNMIGYFEFVAEHADGDNRQRYIIRASKAPSSSTWNMTASSHTEMTFPILDDNGKVKTDNLQAPVLQVVFNMGYGDILTLAPETPQEVLDKMYAIQEEGGDGGNGSFMAVLQGNDKRFQGVLSYSLSTWKGVCMHLCLNEMATLKYVRIALQSTDNGVEISSATTEDIHVPLLPMYNQLVSAQKEQSFTPEEQEQARKNIGLDYNLMSSLLQEKPRVTIFYPTSSRTSLVPRMTISHPLLDMGIDGEFVLMRKVGAKKYLGGRDYTKSKWVPRRWGVARASMIYRMGVGSYDGLDGGDGINENLLQPMVLPTNVLNTFTDMLLEILKRTAYVASDVFDEASGGCTIERVTQYPMWMIDDVGIIYESVLAAAELLGQEKAYTFGRGGGDSCLLGVSFRYVNPKYAGQPNHNPMEMFQAWDANGEPKYIYTAVTPMRISRCGFYYNDELYPRLAVAE